MGEPSVSGRVLEVSLTPGRRDGLTRLALWSGDPEDTARHDRDLYAASGEVTCDGAAVDLAGLLTWLAGSYDCRVTLWPRADRYGAATKGEFTSAPTGATG